MFCDNTAHPKWEIIWTVTVVPFSLDIRPVLARIKVGPFLLGMEVEPAVRIMTDDEVQ